MNNLFKYSIIGRDVQTLINYAHRGASEYAPENTMAAFYLGLELGADGIETDIRKTSDGIPVLFHDENILRITGKDKKVAEMTYDQLYAEDMGSHKGPKYKNEKVVTLEDFLRYFGGKDIELALEIKADDLESDVLHFVKKFNCAKNTIITSFKLDYLKRTRKMDETIRLGYLDKEGPTGIIDKVWEAGINQYCPNIELIDKAMVEYVHSKGMGIRTWRIKTVELMNRAIELEVDGMTVNFPDRLAVALDGLSEK